MKAEYERHAWRVYEKQGEVRGRARGLEIVRKYIAALEDAWGGKPALSSLSPSASAAFQLRMRRACRWIEERALEEFYNSPGWDSAVLTRLRYPPRAVERELLDTRIWNAFQDGAAQAIHETLLAYGCNEMLRFSNMASYIKHYRSESD